MRVHLKQARRRVQARGRVVARATLAGLMLLGLAATPTRAAVPAQGGASPESVAPESVAPPGRVGRIAALRGAVALRQVGGGVAPARQNDPLTSASVVETGAGAQVKLEIGPSRLWLDQRSRLAIDRLDDQHFIATLSAGALFLDVRDPQPGEGWYVLTARATLVVRRTGRFVINAGDATQPSRFSALDAPADLVTEGRTMHLGVERSAAFLGTAPPYRGGIGDLVVDDFTALMGQHDPAEYASSPPVFALPPRVAAMTGGETLMQLGNWANNPAFGPLWYPPVGPSWAPYAQGGIWTYVAPWGWTWLSSESWGFAPFHYGRWVAIDGTWAWAPEIVNAPLNAPPIYAPALVTFLGTNAGVGIGSGFGFAFGLPSAYPFAPLAWAPLWPGEFYLPPYPVNSTYLRAINRANVADPDHPVAPDPAHLAARPGAVSSAALAAASLPARAAPSASRPGRATTEAVVDEEHVSAEHVMARVRPGFARAMAARSAAAARAGFAARTTSLTGLPARPHASSHH